MSRRKYQIHENFELLKLKGPTYNISNNLGSLFAIQPFGTRKRLLRSKSDYLLIESSRKTSNGLKRNPLNCNGSYKAMDTECSEQKPATLSHFGVAVIIMHCYVNEWIFNRPPWYRGSRDETTERFSVARRKWEMPDQVQRIKGFRGFWFWQWE